MNLNSRQLSILDLLKTHKSLSVPKLSELLFFSASTIRRDLELLELENLIRRTHGGATMITDRNAEIPLTIRQEDNRISKEVIGRTAAEFIQSGDSIFLDSSTTVLNIIPNLAGKQDLTIITNGLKTAYELAQFHLFKTVSTGGYLRENSLSFIGGHTRDVLSKYNVDKLFFSTRAMSPIHGISDINEDEAELRRIMIAHANQTFILMDSSKLDKVSLCHVCGMKDIDVLVTEAPFTGSENWKTVDCNIIQAY